MTSAAATPSATSAITAATTTYVTFVPVSDSPPSAASMVPDILVLLPDRDTAARGGKPLGDVSSRRESNLSACPEAVRPGAMVTEVLYWPLAAGSQPVLAGWPGHLHFGPVLPMMYPKLLDQAGQQHLAHPVSVIRIIVRGATG